MWWFLPCILGFIRLYLDGVKVLLYQLFNRSFTLPDLPKQNGKVAIVTGGARGMGYEISRHLVSLDMHVVIAGNEEQEGLAAVKKIHEELNQGKVEFMYLDLASLTSVRQFVQRYKAKGLPLHVLVNNAGVMLVPERRTEDGFELHFGLNYLGHFLLTILFLDVLKKSGKPGKFSRIVIMSSATHYGGRLIQDDLQGRMCYSAHGAYAQSKLALLLFSYHLQNLLWVRGDPVTVNAVDPGMVDTALYGNLSSLAQLAKKPFAKLLFRTPAEGASTAIYAAAASELEGIGGLYLYNGRKTESSALSYDERLQNKLWKESCALVGLQQT
ncbi:dehydrogenase/reductase SDR family member on chromosome X-like isoform X1 [Sinocyclocheilus anshuiensis]|uniref:Dehydrogenase/reductase SDR family member on chromosome X-like n=2 Tax=Sinocyclocheilus anshuiensis TaxID=1608454 RepID=A0A671KM64_9TELE|nr:PREDICTED: dehydrogenase/reductase SDR family member on chromosome X-like isoform X1 [Sinocyclocheilus anshuiensis]